MFFTWIASLCRPQRHWVHPLLLLSISECSARSPVYFLGFHLVNSSLKSYSWHPCWASIRGQCHSEQSLQPLVVPEPTNFNLGLSLLVLWWTYIKISALFHPGFHVLLKVFTIWQMHLVLQEVMFDDEGERIHVLGHVTFTNHQQYYCLLCWLSLLRLHHRGSTPRGQVLSWTILFQTSHTPPHSPTLHSNAQFQLSIQPLKHFLTLKCHQDVLVPWTPLSSIL